MYLRISFDACPRSSYRIAFPTRDAECGARKFYRLISEPEVSNLRMDPAFASLVKQPRDGFADVELLREATVAARRETSSWLLDSDLEVEDLDIPSSGK